MTHKGKRGIWCHGMISLQLDSFLKTNHTPLVTVSLTLTFTQAVTEVRWWVTSCFCWHFKTRSLTLQFVDITLLLLNQLYNFEAIFKHIDNKKKRLNGNQFLLCTINSYSYAVRRTRWIDSLITFYAFVHTLVN